MPTIGQLIRTAREKAGLSQDDLAAALGVAKARVSELENDRANPTLGTLYAYAKTLNVPLWKIIKQAGPPPTP
jgi:transcriptional regulator with XRE-family HTH domain